MLFENIKLVFEVTINIQSGSKWPLTTNPHFVCNIYCLLTKQNFFWCFDAGLEHMAARSRGIGTNFHWLRKSCDISTCDLYCYQPAGHIVTGDLKIITDSRIRSIICKEPEYRFPVPIDFKSCREEIAGALQEFCNRWCKREHVESNALNSWKLKSNKQKVNNNRTTALERTAA